MKLFNIKLIYYSLLLLIPFTISCKVNPVPDAAYNPTLPSSFDGRKDTATSSTITPQQFFTDTVLTKLIETAIADNLSLKIQTESIEINRAAYDIGRGLLLPSLLGSTAAGVEKYGNYTMNGVGNFDTNLSHNITSSQKIPNPTPDFFAGFISFWEIDLWGKLRNRKKASLARLLASEKGQHLLITTLVAEVAKTYYELLSLDTELTIINENINLQEEAYELILVQKSAGRVTELAVEQFEAQLLNTRSKEAFIRQEIVITENKLNLLLGRFPQPITRGSGMEQQKLPNAIKEGIPSDLLRNRPDIRQAEFELAATNADLASSKAAFYPSLTLSSKLGLNAFNAALLANPASLSYGIFSGLTVPIFNRRILKANFKSSTARQRQALLKYQSSILNGFQEVVTHLKGMENYERVYLLKEKQASTLKQAAITSNDLFLAGFASYLEVITAQKNVLDAQIELVNARKQQFYTVIDLYRSLGGGWRTS